MSLRLVPAIDLRGGRCVRLYQGRFDAETVYDDDPTMPHMKQADARDTGGRGIFLLDRIASRWGAEPHGTGKIVWFERDRADPDRPPG